MASSAASVAMAMCWRLPRWRASSPPRPSATDGVIHSRMANSKDLTVDGELVRALASLLQETGLTEIEYAVGERRIRVVRGAPPAAVTVAMPGPAAPAVATAAPAAPATTDLPGAIKAPMVGTAYLSPQPEAPPFIKVGDTVREGQ